MIANNNSVLYENINQIRLIKNLLIEVYFSDTYKVFLLKLQDPAEFKNVLGHTI